MTWKFQVTVGHLSTSKWVAHVLSVTDNQETLVRADSLSNLLKGVRKTVTGKQVKLRNFPLPTEPSPIILPNGQ